MANIIEYLSNMSDYLSALQMVLKYHLDLDLDPALAQGTIILLAVFILLRIVGIPLNYLNLKEYFIRI